MAELGIQVNLQKIQRITSVHLRRRSIKVLVYVAMSLMSCSVPKVSVPFILSDSYKDANLSLRPLVLGLPDPKNIIINNRRDIIDDYGGLNATPQSRIEKFYLPIFIESVRSNMSGDTLIVADGLRSEINLRNSTTKQIALKTDQNAPEIKFTIPTKVSMQEAGLDSSVLVIVDHLTFSRNDLYMEYIWDEKTKRPASLEVNAVVVVWDYKNDSPVFYGTITQKTEFQVAMSRKHWDESARTLAKRIIFYTRCL